MSVPMTALKMENHKDALSGKDTECVLITINGKDRWLSQKSLWRILAMELTEEQTAKTEVPTRSDKVPEAKVANGPPVAVPVK